MVMLEWKTVLEVSVMDLHHLVLLVMIKLVMKMVKIVHQHVMEDHVLMEQH